jgi:hypothetical protein
VIKLKPVALLDVNRQLVLSGKQMGKAKDLTPFLVPSS